jgi:hypothetical protein
MRSPLVLAITLCVVLASCATTGEASPSPAARTPTSSTTTRATAPSSTTSSSSATLGTESTPDLVAFVAAVNEAAIGTSYEDAALAEPEVFIGVGQLFCELLGDGLTVDAVLVEYLTALEDEETGTIDDDDALITGVLMGASLEILCPEHRKNLG